MIDSSKTLLLLISEAAGIILLISVVFLLYKRRVFLDAATGQPVEIEFPVLGKLKTQSPVIAMVVVGAAMVLYPATRSPVDLITVEGDVEKTGGKTVTVTVVPVPQFQTVVDADSSHFMFKIPAVADASYRVKFIVDRTIRGDQSITLGHGNAKLAPFSYVPDSSEPAISITPTKEVPDELLKKIGVGS
jgi:hypothetical protein